MEVQEEQERMRRNRTEGHQQLGGGMGSSDFTYATVSHEEGTEKVQWERNYEV